MSETIDITLVINPSLAEYFEAGMRKGHITFSAAEALTRFLAMVLNDSLYSISAIMFGTHEISHSSQPKAYVDPILEKGLLYALQ